MAFDERRIIALDSIPVRRSWTTPNGERRQFRGLLGASLSVYEAQDFISQYESVLDRLFEEYNLPREKRSYKAAEIYRILATRPRAADAFVFDFSRQLLEIEGPKLNLFVGTFYTQELIDAQLEAEGAPSTPESFTDLRSRRVVPIYGTRSGTQMVTIPELIGKIENPYPAICAWKLTDVTGIYNQHFLLDHFEGEESRAWYELVGHNEVSLVPKGSACNPYISAIDIFLRTVNRKLEMERSPLTPTSLREVLENIGSEIEDFEPHVHHITNEDINMVKPITPKRIPTEFFVKHPIFFIYNEQEIKDERTEIESSPLMQEIHDLAYENLGGVLFYSSRTSPKVMRPRDYFVTYGPKGDASYSRLTRMGFELDHIKKETEE
ncbi:MAG: hypothetical protein ACE5IJ_04925 [Thermoplasmata archaeon]